MEEAPKPLSGRQALHGLILTARANAPLGS
jgi:hypothetical protein